MTDHTTHDGHGTHSNASHADEVAKIAKLVKEFRFGMLTTIEGSGSLVAHPLTIQEADFDGELWNPAAEAWFPDGPEDPNVGVLKFTASGGEYWDTPGGRVATVFSFIKSKVSGEPIEGDNGKVEL